MPAKGGLGRGGIGWSRRRGLCRGWSAEMDNVSLGWAARRATCRAPCAEILSFMDKTAADK